MPTNIVLEATQILDVFYEFSIKYTAYESGYYTVSLQNQTSSGWQNVKNKTVFKDNTQEVEQEVFLFDSINVLGANNYRAVCSFRDSSIFSNSVSITKHELNGISIYPSPNSSGIFFINSDTAFEKMMFL